ncbi:putative lipid II flippase FtsW [Filobacillus milosensis]|uniref:Probable peptidoglycan glycosyltransferase FtsW n=1 Tax=Filobacillus milosensis TaxID=94137 RepID=A0A4Y8ITP9_9BACI|nr:putative lipid II flippase FtsW [Filobacillus milosensis]TFB24296.1 putative lipid II flippase FtsW [Filobacillus milosensis]
MKKHLKNMDYPLLVIILLLSLFGLVMVYSASFVHAGLDPNVNDPAFYFKRQRLWLILGLFVFFFMSMFSYRRLGQLTPLLFLITFLLLLAVIIPGLGVTRNGATRWLDLGFFLLQPSELAKISMVLYFAYALTKKEDRLDSFNKGLLPPLLLLLGVFTLIVLQPDFGTAASIMIACGIILLFAGAKFIHLLGLGSVAIVGALLLILGADYRRERLTSFMDPFADPSGDGYQLIHSLIAIASGKINGVGLANSVQKSGFLPEAHTDFIMSIIAEELGLIGVLFVIISFMVLMFKGVLIAKRAPDQFGRLLALGITFQIISQAIINMGAISGLLPITGITLPLISYGGSSLLITFAFLGILMNIAIKGNIVRGYNREEEVDNSKEKQFKAAR